jgi:hypothetical protein
MCFLQHYMNINLVFKKQKFEKFGQSCYHFLKYIWLDKHESTFKT